MTPTIHRAPSGSVRTVLHITWGVVAALCAALLGGCSPTTTPPPTPAPVTHDDPNSPEPTLNPTPEPPPARWTATDVGPDLTTPKDTRVVQAPEPLTHKNVTGWYASLELDPATTVTQVANDLAEQLTATGATVDHTTRDQVHVLSSELRNPDDGATTRYDIHVIPTADHTPATVTILYAHQPGTTP